MKYHGDCLQNNNGGDNREGLFGVVCPRGRVMIVSRFNYNAGPLTR